MLHFDDSRQRSGNSRVEDRPLLRGRATFLADIVLSGMLEAVVVRSPVAHATLDEVNTSSAEALGGVHRVFTAQHLPAPAATIKRPFYQLTPRFIEEAEVDLRPAFEPVLAAQKVRRVGEPLALIIANSRSTGEDAREAVHLQLGPLSIVANPSESLVANAPEIDPLVPRNRQASFRVVVGEPAAESARAPHRVRAEFRLGRSVGSPLENRGVLSRFEEGTGELTVWSTTQIPHVLRSYLAAMLEMPEARIRVIAPAMGGSFGGGVYPEEILIPWAAKEIGRPIRWVEDRTEDLVNSRHSRDQLIDAELSFDQEGRFRSLRTHIIQDCGAVNPFGITLPHNIASHIRGVYAIDHFEATGLCVLTNKTRNTPVRGAGRPEATFVMDRLIDMAARRLQMDPAELRRRNLIPASAIPHDLGMLYRDGNQLVYDSGDFPDQFEQALETAGYDRLRDVQRIARAEGRCIGIGLSCHVEATGLGPHEGAHVSVDTSGRLVVRAGSQPHGQSHATVLAQVCAGTFGVDVSTVDVLTGDTSLLPFGGGTFGSRSAVTAGSAVRLAAMAVRDKALEIASRLLEVGIEDLVVGAGYVTPRGVPDAGISLGELAAAARPGPGSVLADDPGLEATEYFVPAAVTFGSGTHVALVEVDADTGRVEILDYVIVEDCGTPLNPAVVDGQQHGGAAHGIGNALLEKVHYDRDGQPLNATFMDYLLPTAMDVPSFRVVHRPHPTPLNPLGVKGTGEGATASAPAAIANAIVDALEPLGIQILEMPIGPDRLVELVTAARTSGPGSSSRSGSVAP